MRLYVVPVNQKSRVNGPAAVTFDDAAAIDTVATFVETGVYALRLTADDGTTQMELPSPRLV